MENGYGWILIQANLLVMDNDMKKSIYNHFVRWKDFYYGVNLMRGNGIFLTARWWGILCSASETPIEYRHF